jgi:hypothetical protein
VPLGFRRHRWVGRQHQRENRDRHGGRAADDDTRRFSHAAQVRAPRPAATAPLAVLAAGLAHRGGHGTQWWWYSLGAGGTAGLGGWFFLFAWRRRKDEDEQSA